MTKWTYLTLTGKGKSVGYKDGLRSYPYSTKKDWEKLQKIESKHYRDAQRRIKKSGKR